MSASRARLTLPTAVWVFPVTFGCPWERTKDTGPRVCPGPEPGTARRPVKDHGRENLS